MKPLISFGLVSLILASAYSSVYACDHTAKAAKATKVTTTATNGKTIRTLVVGATTGCQTVDRNAVMSFDIDVPGRTSPRYVHIEATQNDRPEPSVFRTAIALGRALVTTVEAVVGSLLDAASEKTASLV